MTINNKREACQGFVSSKQTTPLIPENAAKETDALLLTLKKSEIKWNYNLRQWIITGAGMFAFGWLLGLAADDFYHNVILRILGN